MNCNGSLSEVVYNALWDLYNSTNGIHWTWSTQLPASTIWTFPSNLSTPCSHDWQGLVCSRESQNSCSVDKIVLNSYDLSGYLPSSLGNIVSLTGLELVENSLIGTIPSELGYLTLITDLLLYSNSLSGTIPSTLGNTTLMEYLYLYDNSLSGTIPCELGNLLLLQYLYLYSNSLTGTIPSETVQLVSLQYLIFDSNALTGTVPSGFGKFSSMQGLMLFSNDFTGTIPGELGNLSLLLYLYMFYNYLTGTIPSELGNLSAIQDLILHSNSLSGTIPSQLSDLQFVEILYLDYNSLTGTIPCQLGSLQYLLYLYLDTNCLTGSIPRELGNFPSIQYLYLDSNSISGTIPADLGNLSSMQALYLCKNCLTGTIPCELGSLLLMGYFYLYSNRLTGTIPCELGNLQLLEDLFLFSNSLSGPIPEEIGNVHSMESLALYSNSLTGTISSQLGNLQAMSLLSLFSNSLTGTIPCELGNLSMLQDLLLYSNQLSGTIPSELGNLKLMVFMLLDANRLTGTFGGDIVGGMSELTSLGLAGNSLSGSIPVELISSNETLYIAFFDGNMLTGALPPEFGICSQLKTIDLSSNYISGDITPLAYLPVVTQIDASLNAFTGLMPEAFRSFLLQSVDLSGNMISGSLGASQFANCSQLKSIAFGSNMLAGTVPGYLNILPSLVSLNASGNMLFGDLSGFANSTGSIQSLDLSSNRLTGTLPSELFEERFLQDVILFSNCFSGSLPGTLCSGPALEYLVMNQLTSNCGSGILKSLQPIFQGSVSKRLMSGSIPDCVWRMSGLKLLQLSGNGLTGTIGDAVNGSSLESLLLSGNQLTGPIPVGIQTSVKLNQLDLSQNRLSGTLTGSLKISSVSSSVFKVSVNRLSGDVPGALFSTDINDSIDVLNGNQFSCSSNEGVAGWGSVLSEENLPQSDPNYDTYTCGSSLFDDYLLLSVVIFVLALVLYGALSYWIPRHSEIYKILREVFLIPMTPYMFGSWATLTLLAVLLMILFVSFHSSSSLTQFSTHSESYLWVTTAAFLRGWAPVVAVIVAVGVGEVVAILARGDRTPLDSVRRGNKWQWWVTVLAYSAGHLFNIVIVVAINAAYVYATVNGLTHGELFAVQFFLGCFKLVWNGAAIPWFFRVSSTDKNATSHRVFMSLFAFIGGPFISTFFSASNCFLYVVVQQPALSSTIEVPQFDCSPSCEINCADDFCFIECPSTCEFQQTSITTTSTPVWSYSYQCSSTLLLDYIPVLIATMAVSGLLLPCVVVIQFVTKDYEKFPLFQWFASRSMVIGEAFDVRRLGRFFRVKTLVNMTTMLTFGFSSPLLGVFVLLDTMSWNGMCQMLLHQQLDYLKERPSIPEAKDDDEAVGISELIDQALKESTISSSDSLMVVSFVGVFWSLFVFDMIGDVYGDLSGGLSMLMPLLMGTVIWWVLVWFMGKLKGNSAFDRPATITPGIELCDDFVINPVTN